MEKDKIHEGENLRIAMKAFENPQDYLARKTGFSQQKISTLLKEKTIPQPELQTICKVIDIEPKKITSNFVVRQYEKFKTLLKQKKGK